jgi:proteasome accessory factor B
MAVKSAGTKSAGARNEQVARIYAVLNILEGAPQGLSIQEILDRVRSRGHETDKRTIYRDIEALSQTGFPLMEDEQKTDKNAVRWKLDRGTKVTDYLIFSSRELLALYLAREALSPLRDTPFYGDLQLAFAKIEGKLGKRGKEFVHDLSQEIRFEPGPKWGVGMDQEVLEAIRAACSERQLLEIEYSSVNSRDRRARRIGPHYLYFSKGSMYLIAEDLADRKVKTFSIGRISSARMLDESYAGKIVEPEELFGSSLGIFRGESPLPITIDFLPAVASYVKERQWHATQRVRALKDGAIRLNLEVAVTPDLIQWILGFGPHAVVQEPEMLKNKVIAEARGILSNYQE